MFCSAVIEFYLDVTVASACVLLVIVFKFSTLFISKIVASIEMFRIFKFHYIAPLKTLADNHFPNLSGLHVWGGGGALHTSALLGL